MKNRGRPSDTAPPGLAGFRKMPFFGHFLGFFGFSGPPGPPGPPRSPKNAPPGPDLGPQNGDFGPKSPAGASRRASRGPPRAPPDPPQGPPGDPLGTPRHPKIRPSRALKQAPPQGPQQAPPGPRPEAKSGAPRDPGSGLGTPEQGFAEPVRSAARSAVARIDVLQDLVCYAARAAGPYVVLELLITEIANWRSQVS